MTDETRISRRSLVGISAAGLAAGLTFVGAPRASAAPIADPTVENRVRELGVYISAENFPGVDPSGASDSTAGMRAAFAAVPVGGTAIIAPGTYRVTAPINDGRVGIRIVGHGATLVQSARAPVIQAKGTYGTILPVTVDSVDATNGSATTRVARLTTSQPSGWAPGTLLRIVSDDAIPEARTPGESTASRLGEFSVVRSVDGLSVVCTGPLKDVYATNVRAASAPLDTIEIVGLTITTSDDAFSSADGFGALIVLIGLHRPCVRDVRVDRASGPAVQVAGCYGYRIEGLDVGRASNGGEGLTLGYGVLDSASTDGLVLGCTMRWVRHAYTDDTPRMAPGTAELWNHGRTLGTTVAHCTSLGTASHAFDTHHASRGIRFTACSATSGGPGAAGFGLRGVNHIVDSGRVDAMDFGVMVYSETTRGGISRGHIVRDLVARAIAKTAVAVIIRSAGHPEAGVRDQARTLRLVDATITDSRWALDVANAVVDVDGLRVTAPVGVAAEQYAMVRNRNSVITVANAVFDATANTAGRFEYCRSGINDGQTQLNVTELRSVQVLQTASVATRANRLLTGASHRVIMRDVEIHHPFPTMPGTYDPTSLIAWRCLYDAAVARSDLSSAFQYVEGDLGRVLTMVWCADDDHVTVQLQTGSSAYTLAPFEPGRRRAQRLTLWSTGTGTTTINSGTSFRVRNLSNTVKVMRRDQVARYWWDGGLWREEN